VQCIDIGPEMAEDALLVLGRHVPPGTSFGRPLVALNGRTPGEVSFLVESGPDGAAVWFVSPIEAARLVRLPGALVELVTFVNGAEVDRIVKHERDTDLPELP